MNDSDLHRPGPVHRRESSLYRSGVGVLVLLGGLAALAGLYFLDVPEGNREPLLLALGFVLGWGGTVVGYEFGSSPSDRKAASAAAEKAMKR
ncbi:MAG: hypothetical protein ACFBQW_07210 [Sphingomonadaceae bacterium]